jgi:hypothetical protein
MWNSELDAVADRDRTDDSVEALHLKTGQARDDDEVASMQS